MRNLILLIILTSASLFAQNEKDKNGDVILFNQGKAIYELVDEDLNINSSIRELDTLTKEGRIKYRELTNLKESILDRALEYFKTMTSEYPDSALFFKALNNSAQIQYELEDYEVAMETYKQILASEANDKDLGGIGTGIMAGPYANYKNRACKMLAGMEHKRGNYADAIKYLKLTEKYPYYHFCGNEYAAEEIFMAGQYALNYVALNEHKQAIKVLLPYILTRNEEIVSLFSRIIKAEFAANAIEEYNKIAKTLKSKYINKDNEKNYFLTFDKTEIRVEIPFEIWMTPGDNKQFAAIKKALADSDLRKNINETASHETLRR